MFGGSIVKRGELTGVVLATGADTFFGQTAKLVRAVPARLLERACVRSRSLSFASVRVGARQ